MKIPLFVGYEAHRSFGGDWRRGQRVELDAIHLPRHTFVCGSTGSGKTVFAKAMVEEAILQGIPTIVLDVKGDLASLALSGADVDSPWVGRVLGDGVRAARAQYREGVAGSSAVQERLGAYAARVHPRVFTPRSGIGRRIALASLPSFSLENLDAIALESLRRLNEGFAQALIGKLFGANAVGRKTKDAEYRVIEALNWKAMERGESFDGPQGIRRLANLVAECPLPTIGGLEYDEFLPPKRQAELRRKLATSIAGAGEDWFRGERLSVEGLLGDAPPGRVPLAIVYLGHLNDFEEQAFVVAQVATTIYQWMRGRAGSSRPQLLLYMDEVGGGDAKTGFFPSAPYNPVSKSPLSLLVKQGRSAGVATLLATQNPVSVDLRALANVHTWAVGRLTQSNDQKRVKSALSEGHTGAEELQRLLPGLPTHTFLVKSEGSGFRAPQPVQERWLYSIHEPLGIDAVARLAKELEGRDWSTGGAEDSGVLAWDEDPVVEESEVRAGATPEPKRKEPSHAEEVDEPQPTETLPLGDEGGPSEAEPVAWTFRIGTGVPRRLRQGQAVALGRSRGADVQLDDQFASGRHVELLAKGDVLVVRDLGARNPARLEGAEVREELEVAPETAPARLVVGKTEVVLEWGSPE